MRKVVDSELGFVADAPSGKSEAKVKKHCRVLIYVRPVFLT